MDIKELLQEVVASKASDLHLRVPSPPILRVDGELIPLSKYPGCSADDIRQAFEEITNEVQRERFYSELELSLIHI